MGKGEDFAKKLIDMFSSEEMRKEPEDRAVTPTAIQMTGSDLTHKERIDAIIALQHIVNTRPPQFIRLLHGEVLARCPGCDTIGRLNKRQFEGRLSMKCDCGYHEMHDLRGATALETWNDLIGD